MGIEYSLMLLLSPFAPGDVQTHHKQLMLHGNRRSSVTLKRPCQIIYKAMDGLFAAWLIFK
uniref:Uncharacterized protein n=1 Tax=Anguilla anguilla TaxID=7936 RepID=A0A0E9US61_ANGAN